MIYICKTCGKAFQNKAGLGGHQSSHQIKQHYHCDICNKDIITTLGGFNHHVTNHTKITDEFNKLLDNCYCQYCNKKCKSLNSLKQHEVRCKSNQNNILPDPKDFIDTFGSARVWNKGLTKQTDERVRRCSEGLIEYYKTHPGAFTGKHHTDESKNKVSVSMTNYDHGNNRRRTHGKGGYFDGIYFQSTWELCFYVHMKDLGKDIQRCLSRYKYEYEGKTHYYTPDFILEGKIIEIKGYETKLDIIKYSVVPNIRVLYYGDIKESIEYVKNKYGVNDVTTIYS